MIYPFYLGKFSAKMMSDEEFLGLFEPFFKTLFKLYSQNSSNVKNLILYMFLTFLFSPKPNSLTSSICYLHFKIATNTLKFSRKLLCILRLSIFQLHLWRFTETFNLILWKSGSVITYYYMFNIILN